MHWPPQISLMEVFAQYFPLQLHSHPVHTNVDGNITQQTSTLISLKEVRSWTGTLRHCYAQHPWKLFLWPQYLHWM